MAFVCKQTAVLVVRINNFGQYNIVATFLSKYFTTYLS